MISIAEEISVPSPPDKVWAVVSDPSAVVSCIAGAELGAVHEDGSFDGALVVKFGALRVKFAALVSLELAEAECEGRRRPRPGRSGSYPFQRRRDVPRGRGPGPGPVAGDDGRRGESRGQARIADRVRRRGRRLPDDEGVLRAADRALRRPRRQCGPGARWRDGRLATGLRWGRPGSRPRSRGGGAAAVAVAGLVDAAAARTPGRARGPGHGRALT